MEVDLRNRFERERESQRPVMPKGHEQRFLNKLEARLPTGTRRRIGYSLWLKIAASFLVPLGIFLYMFDGNAPQSPQKTDSVVGTPEGGTQSLSLGDLSPDLKMIETYYTTNINLRLSDLADNRDHWGIMEDYLGQLGDLNMEYEALNLELNQLGPNDQTIAALVRNLQLRLELLQRLKSKMDQLKSSKNEQQSTHVI